MTNWIFSFITGGIIFALVFLTFQELGISNHILPAIISLVTWISFGIFFNNDNGNQSAVSQIELTSEIHEQGVNVSSPVTSEGQVNDSTALQNAVLELTKQLRTKEKEIEALHTKVSENEFRRSLSRIASINETLGFTLKLLNEKRLSTTDAVEQLRAEIASAVSDLGIDIYQIIPGTIVSSLPFGSFVIMGPAAEAPTGQAGTVKEVIAQGLCVRDQNNKLHFISPSKITIYKL